MLFHTRMLKIAAAAAASAAIACTSVFAADVVCTSSVNVRSGPATSYPVLTVMQKGVVAEKLGTKDGWVNVKINGKNGYVYNTYVKDVQEDKPSTDAKTKTVTITATSLRVRSGASASASVIGSLKKGSTAEVVGKSGDWYKIKYGKGYGYISTAYAKDI